MRSRAKKAFYDEENGLYSFSEGGKEFTELANSLAIIAGLAKDAEAERIASALIDKEVTES